MSWSREQIRARPLDPIDDELWAAITTELGREPIGLHRVAVRHGSGRPAVLEVVPLVDGVPFPTLYWLCSRPLRRAIAELERSGLISSLEAELLGPTGSGRQVLSEAHARYRAARWSLLQKYGHEMSDLTEAQRLALSATGIGGIRDESRIKCLHLHYAHHLADHNPIGQVLDERYQMRRVLAGP